MNQMLEQERFPLAEDAKVKNAEARKREFEEREADKKRKKEEKNNKKREREEEKMEEEVECLVRRYPSPRRVAGGRIEDQG